MPSNGTIVMLGLPGSGKTTFLAALWHQIESSEIETAFIAERLQPDREYLNSLRETWLAFEEISHTSTGIEKSALLHLRHVASGAEFDLSIPDVAGERFKRQWLDRQLPKAYVEQLQQAFGILLFLHCRDVEKGSLLQHGLSPRDSSPSTPADWDPTFVSTQVRLIDLLQSAQSVFERSHVLRVGVIISAWDEVEETITPKAWLERRLPLLDQFLHSNSETLCSRVFGVSAIGGSLEDRESLALTPTPSSRVRVQDDSGRISDLSLPIEFLTIVGRPS